MTSKYLIFWKFSIILFIAVYFNNRDKSVCTEDRAETRLVKNGMHAFDKTRAAQSGSYGIEGSKIFCLSNC